MIYLAIFEDQPGERPVENARLHLNIKSGVKKE
jgi:hypothetical protein